MKKILSLILFSACGLHAQLKISQLPVSGTLTGTEVLPIVQGGVTKQVTAQNIANLGGAGSGWGLTGNTTTTNNFIGTLGATDFDVRTNNQQRFKITSNGVFLISPTVSTSTVSGSFWYDNILNGLTVRTNPLGNDWGTTLTNGTSSLSFLPFTATSTLLSVFNGPWIVSRANENMIFVINGDGGGVGEMVLAKHQPTSTGNSPLILNGYHTYTATALLRVTAGGLANYIECESQNQGFLPFRLIKRNPTTNADLTLNGSATIGSTVYTSGQPTLNVVGNASVSATASVGGLVLSNGSEGVGKYLISDASGLGTWTTAPGGGGSPGGSSGQVQINIGGAFSATPALTFTNNTLFAPTFSATTGLTSTLSNVTASDVACTGTLGVTGRVYFGASAVIPTAKLHLAAGTTAAGTAPQKYTSGPLMSTAEVGAEEFLTDKRHFTISTATQRVEYTFNNIALTSGRIPFATTHGRLTDLAAFTYATNRLSPTYVTLGAGAAAAGSAPLVMTTGPTLTTKIAGAWGYTTPRLFFTNGRLIEQEIPQIQQSRVTTNFNATSNITLANVTGLTANVAASGTYKFKAVLFTTSDVTAGVKFSIGGTAVATNIIYEALVTNAGLTTQSRGTALAATVGAVTAVTAAYCVIEGIITVTTAGTLTVQFAQNVSNAVSSVVLAGSNFQLQEMN